MNILRLSYYEVGSVMAAPGERSNRPDPILGSTQSSRDNFLWGVIKKSIKVMNQAVNDKMFENEAFSAIFV